MKYTRKSLKTVAILLFAALAIASANVLAQSLVGHWLTGDGGLADESGYQPLGTHDGYADGTQANLAWSGDVPVGFTGVSLELTAGNVGVRSTNGVVGDGNYQTIFDDQLVHGFTVAFWANGFPGTWNPMVHGRTFQALYPRIPCHWPLPETSSIVP